MNRKDLEQLRALKQELVTLEEKYMLMAKGESLGDTYGDYKMGFKKVKVMYGKSSAKADALSLKIKEKTEKLKEMIASMEDYLDGIEDAEMRDILRLYYVCGLSQEEVATRKGYTRTAITKKLLRYWEIE